MSIKKMICYVFGHNFTFGLRPDLSSEVRICKLCNKKQIRVNHSVFSMEDMWMDG